MVDDRDERLGKQMAFLLELDKLKQILRRNPVSDGTRRENDAEHTWHLAAMALVLAEHAGDGLDLLRVLEMLIVHDVVEIDAGDTFVYDDAAQADKEERETAAADRIFGLLPDDQAKRLRGLWEEFEARVTREARFAAAVDRLQPLMLNHATSGGAWLEHGVTSDRVLARNAPIGDAAPTLWAYARHLIEDSVARGYLLAGPITSGGRSGPLRRPPDPPD